MNKVLIACILAVSSVNAFAGNGILEITAEEGGWLIYIEGKKKAMTAEPGQSIKLQLPEGDHTLKAVKEFNQWNDKVLIKPFFMGADMNQPLELKMYEMNVSLGVRISLWDLSVKPGTIEHNRKQMAEQGWVVNGDGTATNSKTGLTWKRCLEGQTWTGTTCTGDFKKYTWHEAIKLKSNFAGKSDWRLPSIDELKTIIYCSSGYNESGKCLEPEKIQFPAFNLAVFPVTTPVYKEGFPMWSASPYAAGTGYAWVVFFGYGYDLWGNKSNSYSVRLVRGQ